HNHPEIEINLVMGISGHRIVGDSSEPYNGMDLVLLGPYLHHKWYGNEDPDPQQNNYRVITIQFDPNQFNMKFFAKDGFVGLLNLLKESQRGIRYTGKTFDVAARIMVEMTENRGFENIILFLKLLNEFAKSNDAHYLTSFSADKNPTLQTDSRIQTAFNYIFKHYTDPKMKVADVAS